MKKKETALKIFLIFIGLVLVSLLLFLNIKKQQTSPKKLGDDSLKKVEKGEWIYSEENGFGDLSEILSQKNSESSVQSQEAAISSAAGRGGGGDAMIYPPIAPLGEYRLVYSGGDFDLAGEKVQVLKRKKGVQESFVFTEDFLNNFKEETGLDMGKFDNLKLSNLNLFQDKEFGLNFSFDLANSSLYIGAQWNLWNTLDRECQGDQTCYEKNRPTQKDWLSEQEFTAIADEFLSQIGISRDNYQSGRLDDQRYLAESGGFVPETATVFYQQKINNRNVFDQSGNPDGLRVEVDVRHKKVRGASPIVNFDFFVSEYAAEDNHERIIEIAENGGWGGSREIFAQKDIQASNPTDYQAPEYPFEEEKNKKEIQLGKPESGWIKVWKYDYQGGNNDELFIPAYIFPVLGQDRYFWPKNIVVPAVKEK